MKNSDNSTVSEAQNLINKIFDLQDKLRDKDIKILQLEFELALEKQFLRAFKKYHLESFLTVN